MIVVRLPQHRRQFSGITTEDNRRRCAQCPPSFIKGRHRCQVAQHGSASSCIVGVEEINYRISNSTSENKRLTVRLYFAELEGLERGERTFNVWIQDQRVLLEFDVVSEAGAKYLPIVKEFTGIEVDSSLTIRFEKKNGLACLAGLEVIPEN